jgi:GMP synthase (glutamine-hydrolysing)
MVRAIISSTHRHTTMNKPVLILQHLPDDGPGHLLTWLRQRGLGVDLRHTRAGDTFPADMTGHAALAVLGGAWSANDDRPSLRAAEALIRDAVARGAPVLGHCLGGQLMSRALGGRVGPSPQPERGWHPVRLLDEPAARAWFGPADEAVVFHWHGEAFSLPAGALALAGSAACPVQAFALGPHLAMQFHVEVDAGKLAAWAEEAAQEARPEHEAATWHGAPRVRADTPRHLAASLALADRIYGRWAALAGLV